MARLSTCKGCGKKLQSTKKYTHNSKSYCKECYEKILRDGEEYKQLIEFICTNYEIDRPTGLMLKQIKDMKTEYGWPYSAMTYTLWYCKEILQKRLIEKYGVVLIKHHYEDAKEYYSQQEKMKEQVKNLENVEIKTKVVKRNQSVIKNNNSSLVNLNNLLEGGGTY